MGKLIYSVIVSLDGYTSDEAGNFDWAEPDEEVHSFINDTDHPAGPTPDGDPAGSPFQAVVFDFSERI